MFMQLAPDGIIILFQSASENVIYRIIYWPQ